MLRVGEATTGQIAYVPENYHIRVNGRYPWKIQYVFKVQDRDYRGSVSALNPPGPALQTGRAARVLYLPSSPEMNSLYPHP